MSRRKSPEQVRLAATARKDRPRPPPAPQALFNPAPPPHLDAAALVVWHTVVLQLAPRLQGGDEQAAANYAVWESRGRARVSAEASRESARWWRVLTQSMQAAAKAAPAAHAAPEAPAGPFAQLQADLCKIDARELAGEPPLRLRPDLARRVNRGIRRIAQLERIGGAAQGEELPDMRPSDA